LKTCLTSGPGRDPVDVRRVAGGAHPPYLRLRAYRDRRKLAPGLILRAAQERDINLAQSWFIGDILDDIEAGHRAGCRTVLIDNGNETEWVRSPGRTPDWMVFDLVQAACAITSAKALKDSVHHCHG
jgi:D-glycero-D-manno-heptose 1,7-bisphosphate phosphatase